LINASSGDHRRRDRGAAATDFSALQNELKGQIDQHRDGRVRRALSQRLRPAEAAACGTKTPPEKLIEKTAIQFSESFAVDGPEMYKHACSPGSTGGFKGPRQPLSRRPRQ
jgi:bifunctional non-homologous end joining protein LigD